MKYGISLISVIPVRSKPEEQSEMSTQVLFGETFDILEQTEKWCKIKLHFDNEIGWIDRKTCYYISEEILDNIQTRNNIVVSKQISVSDKSLFPIPVLPGSNLPNTDNDYTSFEIGNNHFEINPDSDLINKNKCTLDAIGEIALSFYNTPYLWGGRSLYGIDCSGFTQILYKICGISIPRNSYQQADIGRKVKLSESGMGDLVFFNNEKGNITHVGMLLDKSNIIHASGKVRIDKIDNKGIYNEEKQKYTHNLHSIQTLI